MVLKSPKGIYMQLETGKIIAIRTALKVGQNNKDKPATVSPFPLKRIAAASPTKQILATGNATVANDSTSMATLSASATANKSNAVGRQRNPPGHVNFGRNVSNST